MADVTRIGQAENLIYWSGQVTIASGASLSNAINCNGLTLVRIDMPDAWTAADLTFQVSGTDETFRDLYDSEGEVSVSNVAADRAVNTFEKFAIGNAYALKIRSGTSGTAVNQGAERVLSLIFMST